MKSNRANKAKPRNAKFWKQKTEDWNSSGLTQKEFCASHNLVLSSFVYWKGKLNRQTKENLLLPVSLVPEVQESPASGLSVSIQGRFKINLERKFCPDSFCRLVELLEKL